MCRKELSVKVDTLYVRPDLADICPQQGPTVYTAETSRWAVLG
jgi:hypothetical protein